MTRGIPDPGGVSGTFAALERTTPIVQVAGDGEPTTTSMRIANGTRNEHRAVLQLIGENLADFEEFGGVAFEMQPFDTAGGVQHRRVAVLNEDHATLLLTYMRNNDVVKDFKKRLVREFSALRRGVVAQSREERLALAVIDARQMLSEKDARIAELEPSAVAWNRLHELGADVDVADAAKILSRDEAIEIGRNRLFEFMYEQDWIFRGRHGVWKAYQDQVDLGRLKHRPGDEFWCKKTERYRTGDPTILVTPKGIAELRRLLGADGQLALVAVS